MLTVERCNCSCSTPSRWLEWYDARCTAHGARRMTYEVEMFETMFETTSMSRCRMTQHFFSIFSTLFSMTCRKFFQTRCRHIGRNWKSTPDHFSDTVVTTRSRREECTVTQNYWPMGSATNNCLKLFAKTRYSRFVCLLIIRYTLEYRHIP